MIKKTLILISLILLPQVAISDDFNAIMDEQGRQLKGILKDIDQKIYDTAPSAKASQLIVSAFNQLKGIIADQVLSKTKKEVVESFSEALLKKFIFSLPDNQKSLITPQIENMLHQSIHDSAINSLTKFDQQLSEDIIASMPQCKDALKMDVLALLFDDSSSNSKSSFDFVFTKPCIIKKSDIKNNIGSILLHQQFNIFEETEAVFEEYLKSH